MTPEMLKKIGADVEATVGRPLKEKLKRAKEELRLLKQAEERYDRFALWLRRLVEGESAGGFMGGAASYTLFVSLYRLGPPWHAGGQDRLIEADLVIVPEVLISHKVLEFVPKPGEPNVQTSNWAVRDAAAIAERMMRHFAAENVTLGTFDDILREPCDVCGQMALVVGMDEFIDDDNGHVFIVGRLCETCQQVHEIGEYYETESRDPQYCRTDGLYKRHE